MADQSRRDFWKKVGAGGLAGAFLGNALKNKASALASGQNFDVISAKFFTNPASNFTTSSTSLVPSTLPVNPTFVKQRSDTYLWVICAIDIVPTTSNSVFNAIMLADNPSSPIDLLQVSIAGPANQLIVVNMIDVLAPGLFPAGSHTFQIYVATNGGSCTWLMPAASFKIMEVTLPALQP